MTDPLETPAMLLARIAAFADVAPDVLRANLVPTWWDDECWSDPHLTFDLAFSVARLFGAPLASVVAAGHDLRAIRGSAFEPWTLEQVRANVNLDDVENEP